MSPRDLVRKIRHVATVSYTFAREAHCERREIPDWILEYLQSAIEELIRVEPTDNVCKFWFRLLHQISALVREARSSKGERDTTGALFARPDLASDLRQAGYDLACWFDLAERKLSGPQWVSWADELTEEPAYPPETIIYFGEQQPGEHQYGVDGKPSVVVSEREHMVLTAFLTHTTKTMDLRALERLAGTTDAREILRELKRKYNQIFDAAIRMPGKKGQGGYHVYIRKATND